MNKFEMDRFIDLNRQGFMKPRKASKAVGAPLPTVACNDCLNWHLKGKHTSDAATRKARRLERGTPTEQRVIK